MCEKPYLWFSTFVLEMNIIRENLQLKNHGKNPAIITLFLKQTLVAEKNKLHRSNKPYYLIHTKNESMQSI